MRRSTLLRAIWPALGLWLVLCQLAISGTGFTMHLPGGMAPRGAASTGKPVNGLMIEVNGDTSTGYGYMPVDVTVRCIPPVNFDRKITLILTLDSGLIDRVSVAKEIEVPAGSTIVSEVISVPQQMNNVRFAAEVWENGYEIEDLSHKPIWIGGVPMYGGYGDVPRLLFVDSPKIDISSFGFLTVNQPNYGPPRTANQKFNLGMVPSFTNCLPVDLHEEWIHYAGQDVILISLADAKGLVTSRPKVWKAISQWADAGGNLIVYGVGSDWSGVAELEKMLQLSSTISDTQPRAGWKTPDPDDVHFPNWLPSSTAQYMSPAGTTTTVIVDADGNTVEQEVSRDIAKAIDELKQQTVPFVFRDVLRGQIVAIASSTPFPGNELEWAWIFNSLDRNKYCWRHRHGLDSYGGNTDFDNFLIADVGLPPVMAYRVLITVFVLGIGPLTYWLLQRSGRLHLLLFVVPAAALLVSVALVSYAIIGDGFSVRLRGRSFTELDQRANKAATWSRLSYYAGRAPSGGLVFPRDTAVFAYESDLLRSRRARYLTWTDLQHFGHGWIFSRTPAQFVTVRPYDTARELTVSERDGECAIANRLGTHIHQLLLCDSAGNWHSGSDIKTEAIAKLKYLDGELSQQEEAGELAKTIMRDPMLPPVDMPKEGLASLFPMFRVSRSYGNSEVSTHTSILEVSIVELKSALAKGELEPRSYIAIVDRPKEVIVGVESPVETQSLHLIKGRW